MYLKFKKKSSHKHIFKVPTQNERLRILECLEEQLKLNLEVRSFCHEKLILKMYT